MTRCLLIGNYGVGNTGDEALREYFLDSFPDIDWVVLSAHPAKGEYQRLPAGIRSLFSIGWIRTIGEYRKADAVIFGGGSLWTDVESVFACFLWTVHLLPALFFRVPVILAFQGIGPFRTGVGEWFARFAVRHSTFVSVRDHASVERIAKWGLSRKIVQTFDPVFSSMRKQKIDQQTKNVFIIIPRHNSDKSLRLVAQSTRELHPCPKVSVLLMQPDDPAERRWAESVGLSADIVPVPTLAALMHEMASATHVVTQRFHGALAALAADVPVTIVAQGDGDKLAELRDLVAQGFDAAAAMDLIVIGERELRDVLRRVTAHSGH